MHTLSAIAGTALALCAATFAILAVICKVKEARASRDSDVETELETLKEEFNILVTIDSTDTERRSRLIGRITELESQTHRPNPARIRKRRYASIAAWCALTAAALLQICSMTVPE